MVVMNSYQYRMHSLSVIEDTLNRLFKVGVSIKYVGVIGYIDEREVYDVVIDRPLPEEYFNALYAYVVRRYRYFIVQSASDGDIVLKLIPIKKSKNRGLLLKITLALITLITVALSGFAISSSYKELIPSTGYGFTETNITLLSLSYTAVFLLTLLSHEAGHMIVSKKAGIAIEGPYLIPAPPLQLGFIGTLGAVINMKSLPPSKRRLAELGLSGPLIGFLVSVLVAFIGLHLSPLIHVEDLVKRDVSKMTREVNVAPLSIALLINSRSVPEGYVILMHPLLFSSYIFMYVTFLNLLPVGQLDGGHVVRAYTSTRIHRLIGYATPIVLLLIGLSTIALFGINDLSSLFISVSLILTLFNVIFGSRVHLGSANQLSTMRSYVYLVVYLLILILTTPVPL